MKPITVTSPLLPDLDEYNQLLQDIWSRKWITNMGHYHEELESALAKYLGVEYISLFTNGTLPLITALQALGIREGEVITTPYSFVATTHSIWWNGLKPVFVDVDADTGNIDPDKIEAAITDKTVAIMPVHVYGCPCDVERIDAIAKRHNLKVIYDAAHAFGVKIAPSDSPKGGVSDAKWKTADPALYECLQDNARHGRQNPTQAEAALWDLLKAHGVGEHFRRQHVIMDYIADFVCLNRRLIVEVDGKYHYTAEQQKQDQLRSERLQNMGFTIIRFDNNQILCEPDNVLQKIKDTLQSLPLWGSREGADRSILSYGDLSTLSFHATKVYNTIEGGAMVMHSAEMKRYIDELKNFGFEDETTVLAPGINSKMDEMRAAYGLLNLKQVDWAIEQRKYVAKRYVEALEGVKGIKMFPYIKEQLAPSISPKGGAIGWRWNFAYFPILVDESFSLRGNQKGAGSLSVRDALYEKMKSHGVMGRRYFYPLISNFEPYSHYESANAHNLPVAKKLADQVICLPMHPYMTEEDINRVLNAILA